MSAVITGTYTGGRTVELRHEASGAVIVTDAPRDSGGEGAGFSPLDLVVAGLGSCVLTTIAMVAYRNALPVEGMQMRVEKVLNTDTYTVSEILLEVHLPAELDVFDRQRLERAGLGCPVHKSLNPVIPVRTRFIYDK